MLFTTWFEHHGAAGNVRGQMILGVFCNNLGVAKWFFYTMDGLVRGYDKPIYIYIYIFFFICIYIYTHGKGAIYFAAIILSGKT